MSSDNAWYVYGSNVYMVDASTYEYEVGEGSEKEVNRYLRRLRHERPYEACKSHKAAVAWAWENYSEYGVWFIEEGDK